MSSENAATNGADTANQPGDSAPQVNDGKTEEANTNASASKQNDGIQKGVKREFFNLREKVRTEREEKENLRSELEALKAQLANSGNGSGNRKLDPLEDPEAYSGSVEKRAEEAAARKFNELLSQHNVQSSAAHSEQWLRSRSHLEDDNKAADEVAEIIANQYAHLVRIDPRAAARSAYTDWCELKGVTPDLSGSSNATPPRHVKPSAAGSGSSNSEKTYTPQEVARTLRSLSSPEAIKAYAAEVEKAAREGRYKGNFIRL